MVIAPALLLQNQDTVKTLKEFVSGGGHLILTIRCGMKDEYNALLPQRQPGGLAEMASIEVEEYYALHEPVPVKGNWFEGQSRLWAERLVPVGKKSARVAARFGKCNGWLDDQIAISVNAFGKGLVYYVGVYLDEPAQQTFLARCLKTARITTINTAPGIEVSARVKAGGEEIYIVINHNSTGTSIKLPWPVLDHLTGQELRTDIALSPYGVVVVTPLKE
jgi:beta-galactosidase